MKDPGGLGFRQCIGDLDGDLQGLVQLKPAARNQLTERLALDIFHDNEVGAIVVGDVAIEKFRLLALAIGLVVFLAMLLVLNRTKLGLLIRAGVENGEMVEALGYRIRRLFVAVFVAGSALAGLGGTMWALYRETLTAGIGGEVIVLVFIVIIIGGLGSVGGCFLGSILVAQMANYTGYLAPKVALASNIGLMVIILMWRPQGLYPVAKR